MIFVVKNVLQKFLFKNLSNIIFGQKTSCPKKCREKLDCYYIYGILFSSKASYIAC